MRFPSTGAGSGEFYHIGVGMGCGNGAAFCGLPEHTSTLVVRHRIRPRDKKRRFCLHVFRIRRSPTEAPPGGLVDVREWIGAPREGNRLYWPT